MISHTNTKLASVRSKHVEWLARIVLAIIALIILVSVFSIWSVVHYDRVSERLYTPVNASGINATATVVNSSTPTGAGPVELIDPRTGLPPANVSAAFARCSNATDWVCGADGVSYTNGCYAAVENVTVAHQGKCTSEAAPTVTNSVACPHEFNPVCGVDGNMYRNSCVAQKANIQIKYAGPCIVVQQVDGCANGFAPVCATDGKNYDSSCLAQQAGSHVAFVGRCTANASLILGPNHCSDTDGFVCGVNNVTFQNACLAQNFGVQVSHSGPCR